MNDKLILKAEQDIKIGIAKEAGLVHAGFNEDKEALFLGNDFAWDNYTKLLEEFNNKI